MKQQAFFTNVMPPTIQDVKTYFGQKGMPDREAEHFFLFYEKKRWRSKSGNFLKSWKNIARNWIMSVFSAEPWLFNRNIH